MSEKRYFKRVDFPAEVQLLSDDSTLHGMLQDISLQGALINIQDPGNLKIGYQVTIRIYISSSDIVLITEADVIHQQNKNFGFKFQHIDVESIGHLRRLLELNLGSSEEITNELEFILKEVEE